MDPRHGLTVMRNQKHRIIDRIRNANPNLGTALDAVSLGWYTIRNIAETDTEAETSEVLIYDEIGGYCGVSAEAFVNDLNALTTPKIKVRINSPGGSLFDGIAIYNALAGHSSYIITQVDALAASAASIIAMGGDECVMMVGSQLMIHDAIGVEVGNAQQFREMADFLERQSNNIASIYHNRNSETSVDEWRNLMLAETWMFAEEAVAYGLADSVYVRPSNAPAPDEDEPEEGDETDAEDVTTADVEALMTVKHRPRADWRYKGGRRQAGKPATNKGETKTIEDKPQAKSLADLISW